ncbi:putative WRKY transcription factor 41 [Cardamine amara subsp. amara]|uniref:WRKY transcription factor 41 n=1 Tax=Cardamine amara subsp. amara TaxID=228776 RepID=A0ABD1B1L6_CARAN
MEMMNWEHKNLLNELIHGLNAAKQLQASPSPPSSSSSSCLTTEMKETLLHQIVSSYEKAIMMLSGSHNPTTETAELAVDLVANSGKIPESPVSITESPKSEEAFDPNISSKKRKLLPKWTEQVRISPERGFDGPHDDIFSWRKYGQKDILGAKYPRSYYRCTFRNTQYCWATKQVQRSDGDPTIFEVTYRGKHTCSHGIPPPPEKRETKRKPTVVNYQNDLLNNLKTNLTVRTDGFEGDAFSFPVTAPFYSFESITGDFSNGGTFGHVGSSGPLDFIGLTSTNTSAGSSPIFDVDFPFDPTAQIDTGFPTFLHD